MNSMLDVIQRHDSCHSNWQHADCWVHNGIALELTIGFAQQIGLAVDLVFVSI